MQVAAARTSAQCAPHSARALSLLIVWVGSHHSLSCGVGEGGSGERVSASDAATFPLVAGIFVSVRLTLAAFAACLCCLMSLPQPSPSLSAAARAVIASGAPTPFYIYDTCAVRAQVALLSEHLGPGVGLLSAVKANPCVPVLAAAIAAGVGVEAVSIGEVLLARALGAASVLFSPSNASDAEYAEVAAIAAAAPRAGGAPLGSAPAISLNVDSLSRLARMPHGASVCLRVNGGLGGGHHAHVITAGPASKFGIARSEIAAALATARERGLRIVGLHQHIGSGIVDTATYIAASAILLDVAEAHASELGDLCFVDVGGGLGVPYESGAPHLDVAALGEALRHRYAQTLAALPSRPRLVLEPGRFLVAAAGLLVARVTCIKDAPGGEQRAGLDTGFNHLCRPMVYGAYHEVSRLCDADGGSGGGGGHRRYIVVGNVCENGDNFTPAGARELPTLSEGDVLALHTAGAYGRAMASEYNVRALPSEYVTDEAARVAAWAGGDGASPSGDPLRRPSRAIDCGGGRTVACATRAQTVQELVRGLLAGGF